MAVNREKIVAGAQKFIQRGQLDKAIKEYQRVLEEDPKDVRTLLKIGDLYSKKGERENATQTYLKVAEYYSDQGFFLKAVAVYKQILKVDPGLVQVNVKLADLYNQLGLASDALAQYQSVALHFEKAGDIPKTIGILRKMIELEPNNVGSRIKLAEVYAKQAMPGDAVAELGKAAALLKQNGRVDDYARVSERILHLQPEDAGLSLELAEFYLERNDVKRALAKLQVCFKSNPRDVRTLEMLAQSFTALGQTHKTVSVYRELAKIYEASGDDQKRRQYLRKILELAPDDEEAKEVELRVKDGGAKPAAASSGSPASPLATTATATSPPPAKPAIPQKPSEALQKLLTETDVYMKYGLRDKALEHLKKIFAIAPDNLDAHGKVRDIYLKSGETDGAKTTLVTMAKIAIMREQPEKARAWLQEAVALDANFEDAKVLLGSLPEDMTEEVDEIIEDVDEAEVDVDVAGEDVAPPSEAETGAAPSDDEGVELDIEPPATAPPATLAPSAIDEDGVALEVADDLEPPAPAAEPPRVETKAPAPEAFESAALEDSLALDALEPPKIEPPKIEPPKAAAKIETPAPKAARPKPSPIEEDFIHDELDLAPPDLAPPAPEKLALELSDDLMPEDLPDGPDLAPASLDEDLSPPEETPAAPPATTAAFDKAPLDFGEEEVTAPASLGPSADEDDEGAGSDELDEGEFFEQQGLTDEAIEAYRNALRKFPNSKHAKARIAALSGEVATTPAKTSEAPAPKAPEKTPEKITAAKAAVKPPEKVAVKPAEKPAPTVIAKSPPVAQTAPAPAKPIAPSPAKMPETPKPAAATAKPAAATAKPAATAATPAAPSTPAPLKPTIPAAAPAKAPAPIEAPKPAARPATPAPAKPVEKPAVAAAAIKPPVAAAKPPPPERPIAAAQEKSAAKAAGVTKQLISDDALSGDSFDLASELADDFSDAQEVAAKIEHDEELQFSAEEIFSEFKKGVAATVSDKDFATHYDLGIAYKEMGLVEDAVREFEVAAQAHEKEVDSLTMVGICRMSAGDAPAALAAFKRAANSDHITPKQALAVKYELACATELAGDADGAKSLFAKVAENDPTFRDAKARSEGAKPETIDDEEVTPSNEPKKDKISYV